jgi:GNAT superfamily N-acetyltransferase
MIVIKRATPNRLAALDSLLAHAFIDEPMVRWPLGDRGADYLGRLTRQFDVFNEINLGLGALYEAGHGLGAAVWLSPEQGEAYAEAAAAASQTRIPELTDDGGRRWTMFWGWVNTKVPDEPLWFLDQVGVDPAHQGRGIGAALIEFGLEQARATQTAAFLETGTPRNVPYYERFGFRVVADEDAPYGGPHVWFMRYEL